MFNFPLFLVLILVCIPGLLVAVPGILRRMEGVMAEKMPPGKTLPSFKMLLATALFQSLLFVAAAAAAGTALAPGVGLGAPFFTALAQGEPLWEAAAPQLLPGLLLGSGGALIIIAAYYLLFIPRLDRGSVVAMEGLRIGAGMATRLLYGGVVEEIIARWGVMTLIAWLAAGIFGLTPAVIWVAIIISGLLFGLGHIPSCRLAGCRITPVFLSLIIFLNLWASLIFGWLFWQYGLMAAMLAHMLCHLVWKPFELLFSRRESAFN